MKLKIQNLFILKMKKQTTLNSTLIRNLFNINAYNEYYLNSMLSNNGIFTNSIKYNIGNRYYKSLYNIPYEEVNLILDIDSPLINTIMDIYSNCERRINEEQEIYNNILNINDIEYIIKEEQRRVLDANSQVTLYNNILNEAYEKMGFIKNDITLYL